MDIFELLNQKESKELFSEISKINNFYIYILNEERKTVFNTDQEKKINFLLKKNSKSYKEFSHYLEDLYIKRIPFLISTSDKFSIIAEPIIIKDAVIAVVIIYFPEALAELAKGQVSLLKQYIEKSITLNNDLDNLSEEIAYNYEVLSTIDDINKSIEGLIDQNKICEVIVEKAVQLTECKRTAILIENKDNNYLETICSYGLSKKDILKCKLNFKEGICGQIFQNGEPILINNLEQLLSISDFENKKCSLCPICSPPFILLPLKSREKIIGLIAVSGKTKEKGFNSRDLKLLEMLSAQAGLGISNAILFKEREEMLLQAVSSLVEAIEAKDPYSSGHSRRVAYFAECLCKELGLSEQNAKGIVLSSLLHDVGKIGITDRILLKPGKLTEEERKVVEYHPLKGEAIVDHFTPMHDFVVGIRSHHERYDGKGYPDGLKGDEIPLPAKIIAIADAFDALTSNRPYRNAYTPDEAISIMIENKGTQFDPKLLDVFVSCFKKGKISIK